MREKPVLRNKYLTVELTAQSLVIVLEGRAKTYTFRWPSVRLSIEGKVTDLNNLEGNYSINTTTYKTNNTIGQKILLAEPKSEKREIEFEVSVTITNFPWIKKRVAIKSYKKITTPDFVEIDTQIVEGEKLEKRGYIPHIENPFSPSHISGNEEEGSGFIAGCGYPLIGRHLFFGLEHPAGFNVVETISRAPQKQRIRLYHHPTWNTEIQTISNEKSYSLNTIEEVIGFSENAEKAFYRYIDTFRTTPLKNPITSLCTFWSDPYLGNNEYNVTFSSLKLFIEAFGRLKIHNPVFILDAGWHDRRTLLQAKKEIGKDDGLLRLNKLAEKIGGKLGLWISFNGPMAFSSEFLKNKGFAIGKGPGAAYSNGEYAVLMDKNFEKALTNRLKELVSRIGIYLLKIDWDNECATNQDFNQQYPTINHVREATINAYFRIIRKVREVNSNIVVRMGWWPSPWWLQVANYVWLPDSGDCEYSSIPSLTPRDSAVTHRDFMYYNVLVRDKSVQPLDSFDNHEFPMANRNPFSENPGKWTDIVWLTFLRGTTYLAMELQPESLELWQIDTLNRINDFCRIHSQEIYGGYSQMYPGNPLLGEIYGFCHKFQDTTWCVLRNPLPIPQVTSLKLNSTLIYQIYPHWHRLPTSVITRGIKFLPHEVKVIILKKSQRKSKPDGNLSTIISEPYMILPRGNNALIYFPASSEIDTTIQPMVDKVQRIPRLQCKDYKITASKDSIIIRWFLEIPHRMHNTRVTIMAKTNNSSRDIPIATISRYKWDDEGYSLPVKIIKSSAPGYGEKRNPLSSPYTKYIFYSLDLPSGGTISLSVKSSKYCPKFREAWIWGYEGLSRNYKKIKLYSRLPYKSNEEGNKYINTDILQLEKCISKKVPLESMLPVQHPSGFPRTLRLPLEGN